MLITKTRDRNQQSVPGHTFGLRHLGNDVVKKKAFRFEVTGCRAEHPVHRESMRHPYRLRCLRRASTATPESPAPSNTEVAGSGTGVGSTTVTDAAADKYAGSTSIRSVSGSKSASSGLRLYSEYVK